MRLFKKHISETKSVASDKAAGWIANAILKVQTKFANTLDVISASWKIKQQWIFLYLVCLVFGGLSTIAIINSFNKKTKQILSKPATIKTPRNIQMDVPGKEVRITDNEIRQVHVFKHTVDSLSKTDGGKIKVEAEDNAHILLEHDKNVLSHVMCGFNFFDTHGHEAGSQTLHSI